MTIKSGFFNSVNGDRKYSADSFASYFASFIGNGVFPVPSNSLQIIAGANMTTVVKAGKGWINGYFVVNDSDYVLQHDIADGVLKRVDRVVMRLNNLTREIEIAVKKGTFASNPVAPTLQRDTDAYELALADVLINNGATQITQAHITDTRLNSDLCGIVHGTVDQVDTTTIFNQYQSAFDNFTTQQQAEFEAWLNEIHGILDGDVAGNLINLIQANTLAIDEVSENIINHSKDIATEDKLGHIKAPTLADGTLIVSDLDKGRYQAEFGWNGAEYIDAEVIDNTVKIATSKLTGIVTKNITPSVLKKWGNAKFVEVTSTNTSVICDVLGGADKPNAIPSMTSNTSPSGQVIYSTRYNTTFDAFKAFNKTDSDYWLSNTTKGYIGYKFPDAKIIDRYSILSGVSGLTKEVCPKDWTFEGSHDGNAWFVLDTQQNATDFTTRKEFAFINETAYLYYRLNITANNGDTSYVGVNEIEFFEPNDVLKNDVQSLEDLSDIDISQYPSLKLRWTLSRDSINDASPTISNPSVTWEGASGGFKKITELGLTSNALTLDFENLDLESYGELKLILDCSFSGNAHGVQIRYNDMTTTYYATNGIYDATVIGVPGSNYGHILYAGATAKGFGNPSVVITIDNHTHKSSGTTTAVGRYLSIAATSFFTTSFLKEEFIRKISLYIPTPGIYFSSGTKVVLYGVKRNE